LGFGREASRFHQVAPHFNVPFFDTVKLAYSRAVSGSIFSKEKRLSFLLFQLLRRNPAKCFASPMLLLHSRQSSIRMRSHADAMTKKLYFGDNLDILRNSIADESVDLIYLDPPFNSKRDYNLLFKTPKGHESDAQIMAFEDTWHWSGQAQDEFREIEKSSNTAVAEMMRALRDFIGENDMMAYLTMMANRLLEMHRVLKPTGSLYLHCDPTASHYLKIVLDGVFGKENYLNEIVWVRTAPKGHAFTRFPSSHDVIFYYSKTAKTVWNVLRSEYDDAYLESHYNHVEEGTGRRYQLDNLINPNANRPNLTYEFLGVTKVWRWTKERMEKAYADGLVIQPKPGAVPRFKRYLDEMPGVAVTTVWSDIPPINSQAAERLGYPTQKPLALLERIISASSNEGDVVLDPFCGCGTALDAAQKLNRQWIGIDITHLAVSLIEKRLLDRYPELAQRPTTSSGRTVIKKKFEVIGVPQDFAGAKDLADRDKHQFQLWACSLVGVQPYRGGKKGADQGIDGMGFIDVDKSKSEKVLVSVKGGENVGASMIRDLKGTVEREKAAVGLFVTLTPPTKPMVTEATSAGHYESPLHGAFPRIQILTIEGLLNGTERAKWPDLSGGAQNFKKAKAAVKKGKQKDLFGE
jgi:site-specific DNA-methyltransferase (adenine-specific)